MDITKLSDLLNKAKSSGIAIPDPPDSLLSWDKEIHAIYNVSVEETIEEELLLTLKKCPELSFFDGKLFWHGSGAIRVELEQLVKCLLYNTQKYGAGKTLEKLKAYIRLDGNPIIEVQLVAGIEVDRVVKLTNDTSLVPFEDIPDCFQKTHFSPTSYNFPYSKYCAQTAILRKRMASPKSWHQDDPPRKSEQVTIPLSHICGVLTLVGPSAPVHTAYWTILDESVPFKCQTGLSGNLDHISYSVYKYKADDYPPAEDLVRKYFALDSNLRDRLLLSMNRLNTAQRRNRAEDKAIDLGIALETLLLQDYKQNDPISFPFRLRGAWFLGREPKKRKAIYELLKAIYDCRSKAVHSGKLKNKKYRIDGEDIPLADLLQNGFRLCANVITQIIEDRSFPNWDDLILGLHTAEPPRHY